MHSAGMCTAEERDSMSSTEEISSTMTEAKAVTIGEAIAAGVQNVYELVQRAIEGSLIKGFENAS